METNTSGMGSGKRYVRGVGLFILIGVVVVVGACAMVRHHMALDLARGGDRIAIGSSSVAHPSYVFGERCTVVALTVRGCLETYLPDASYTASNPSGCDALTSSEEIAGYLQQAKGNNDVKGILLDIDSTGGMPQAAVEISTALKETGKPSVALIHGYGDSAAYWIASAADTIVASKESDIGSIGVTSSYVDNAKQDVDQGLTYNSLSTGKFKDTGNTNKPLTADERALIEKGNQTTLENFIASVAANRKLPVEKVRSLADGSSMLGEEALSNGLIDIIGTQKEALAALQNATKAKPVVCWPQYQ